MLAFALGVEILLHRQARIRTHRQYTELKTIWISLDG